MSPTSHPALSALPATKRALLNLLKKRGGTSVEGLAETLEMTLSGVRQHLTALERDGLVAYEEIRSGPGRPRHVYRLTPAADGLYPRAYAELTNELLSYVEDADPEMIEAIFERRRKRRIDNAFERMTGKSFDGKIAELTKILDDDGYLADCERKDDGTYLITERNCAIFGVAMRYRQACGSELDFIRKVLPEASVERVAHMIAGAHNCSYEIIPQPISSAREADAGRPKERT